jgi:hypothetical protein
MYGRERRRLDRGVVWLMAVPAGLASYLAFLALNGHGFLAPFAQESSAEYGRQMAGPLSTLAAAVNAAVAGFRSLAVRPVYLPSIGGPFTPGAESILLLVVLVIALVALVAAVRRLPLAYSAYALAALVVCTWSPVPDQPLKSVDRYTLTIFPLWMAAGAWVSERRFTRAVVVVSAALLAFWSYQFATWAWVA